jgi:hypothetical protein
MVIGATLAADMLTRNVASRNVMGFLAVFMFVTVLQIHKFLIAQIIYNGFENTWKSLVF